MSAILSINPKPPLTRPEQSRINGAKSKGPATATGKARSSRNALKHGLTAKKHTVLDVEDKSEYDAVSNAAVDEFRPQSAYALRLVEKLAHLDWRLERLAILETAYLNHQVNQNLDDNGVATVDPLAEAAEGTGELAALVRGWIASSAGASCTLDLLRRYSATLEHQYNKTFTNIQELEDRQRARRNDRDLDDAFLPAYRKPAYPKPIPSAPESDPDAAIAQPNPFRPRKTANEDRLREDQTNPSAIDTAGARNRRIPAALEPDPPHRSPDTFRSGRIRVAAAKQPIKNQTNPSPGKIAARAELIKRAEL